MGVSYINEAVAWHFNAKVKDEGTFCYIYSGTNLLNTYGEQVGYSWTGSYMTEVLLTPLRPNERQYLPEGNRNDEVLNAFFQTGSFVAIGNRVMVSGTNNDYEVIQLTEIQLGDSSIPYIKSIVRRYAGLAANPIVHPSGWIGNLPVASDPL